MGVPQSRASNTFFASSTPRHFLSGTSNVPSALVSAITVFIFSAGGSLFSTIIEKRNPTPA